MNRDKPLDIEEDDDEESSHFDEEAFMKETEDTIKELGQQFEELHAGMAAEGQFDDYQGPGGLDAEDLSDLPPLEEVLGSDEL